MLNGKILLCFLVFVDTPIVWNGPNYKPGLEFPTNCIWWQLTDAARLPILQLARERVHDTFQRQPTEMPEKHEDSPRMRIREGVPPPLCAGRVCAAPPTGPVCAFDATGTARTFKTICELEAVSCRESTLYAITSLGEC